MLNLYLPKTHKNWGAWLEASKKKEEQDHSADEMLASMGKLLPLLVDMIPGLRDLRIEVLRDKTIFFFRYNRQVTQAIIPNRLLKTEEMQKDTLLNIIKKDIK